MNATAELIRDAKRQGWHVEPTGSGHLKLSHPLASGAAIVSSTPSSPSAIRAAKALLKRLLPCEVEPKGRNTRSPKPKRRHKPAIAQPMPMVPQTFWQTGDKLTAVVKGRALTWSRVETLGGGVLWRLEKPK